VTILSASPKLARTNKEIKMPPRHRLAVGMAVLGMIIRRPPHIGKW
jgi:hypothetical protein